MRNKIPAVIQEPKRASELEWLKWFYSHADFGPADGDVRSQLKEKFTTETGKELPAGYDDKEVGGMSEYDAYEGSRGRGTGATFDTDECVECCDPSAEVCGLLERGQIVTDQHGFCTCRCHRDGNYQKGL
jgi:hypothetical protein